MGNILDKFIWLFTGIIGSHLGHYLYQVKFADKMSDASLSESLAMLLEESLRMFVRLLDNILPLFIAYRGWLLITALLIVFIIVALILFRMFIKIKNDRAYTQKIKEAENILSEAKTKAETQRQEHKKLQERLQDHYKDKEKSLQVQVNQKLAEYKKRIKQLEQERVELKETSATLMRRLKEKR